MQHIKFNLLCVLGLSAIAWVNASAASSEVRAKSGLSSDIQAAISNATCGSTVVIPAGTWALTETVRFSEGVSIRGEGKKQTILQNAIAGESSYVMFRGMADGSGGFRFSGLTLRGKGREAFGRGDESVIDGGLVLAGRFKGFLVHDCRFEGFSFCGVHVQSNVGPGNGHSTGVLYQNEFVEMLYATERMGLGYGVAVNGFVADWSLHLGAANAVFVEDCYFERCRHSIASNSGSRYVFRHNTVKDNYYPWAAVDAHGKQLHPHGSRSYEIYSNRFSGGIDHRDDSPKATWSIGIRGGDGVIFDNHFADGQRAIYLTVEGGIRGRSYPATDQVMDLWLWNNVLRERPLKFLNAGVGNDQTEFFREGKNYHFKPKPDYKPYPYPHPLRTAQAR